MMSDRRAFTRREFLETGLVVVSTITSLPMFLEQSALLMAGSMDSSLVKDRPGVPGERVLVVVQLSGGNDGLNTVVPYGFDEYYRSRPTLAVPKKEVLILNKAKGIGLNPELGEIREMLDEGLGNVVQGVGYPNPNRSHFASMDIWHTADIKAGKGLGWIGKAMDEVYFGEGSGGKKSVEPTACVCIGHESPLAAEGKHVKPVTFENAEMFRWAGASHPVLGAAYDRINRAGVLREVPLGDASQAAFVMRTALDAQLASDRVRDAVARGTATSFPGNPLGSQLKMVASMIRADMPTRVYYVGLGGFDTHANQANRHNQNLRQFASSMRAFYRELKAVGQDGRVLTVAFSEFGRRVEQNASGGTDHGTAGPVFMFGPMVRPGLLGEHPSLDGRRLDDGDLVYGVDFRSVYATVLDQWLKVDSKKVLGQSFKAAQVLNPKAVG